MTTIDDKTVLDKLRELGEGICLIKAGGFKGTGFHYGGGWVMSAAHNFQDNENDPESFHSFLKIATFTFTVKGETITFSPPPHDGLRMAFIHHLKPGDDIDERNMDIGMVKLGHQYEYGRTDTDYQDWEKGEQTMVCTLPAFAKTEERSVKANDTVYAIHYGGDNHTMKTVYQTVQKVNENLAVPTIELSPPIPLGSSGCPILNTKYTLVGLLTGGWWTDDALMWTEGIEKYISKGVNIILNSESYLAYRAEGSRENLVQQAKESKLTIYLMNREVIN